jgi:replication factor A1
MSRSTAVLDSGVLSGIFRQEMPPSPILQVIDITVIPKPNVSQRRYRVSLSDGTNYSPAVISYSLNPLFETSSIRLFNTVRMTDYFMNQTLDQPVLIVVSLEVVATDQAAVIGAPVAVDYSPPPLVSSQVQPLHSQSQRIRPPPTEPPGPSRAMAISHLNPYIQGPILLAKVVLLGPVIPFRSRTGQDGKLMNVILKDKSGSEIRGTFFNEQVDRFLPIVQQDRVYRFAGGTIRSASARFHSTGHDCELRFTANTTIDPVDNDPETGRVTLAYRFTRIADLLRVPPDRDVDILAWVVSADPLTEVQLRNRDRTANRRRLEMADQSGKRCELTLWDADAASFPDAGGCVISVKDARVSSFRGRTLSANQSSILRIDPEIPEAFALRRWALTVPDFRAFQSISTAGDFSASPVYLAQINAQELGKQEQADYVTVICCCAEVFIHRRLYYAACPTPSCRFKGFSGQLPGDGAYVCDRCHQAIDTPKLRYNFALRMVDFSGSVSMTVLGDDEIGALFTGVTVDDWVFQTDDGQNIQAARKLVAARYFRPVRVRCKVRA